MAPDGALLRVAGLDVHYGGIQAVRAVEIDVHAGELVAIVGPNGAGKTSLLSAIFGLVPPSAGSVDFAGASLRGVAPEDIVRRGLALVPEGRHIFQSLTVAENLALGATVRGRPDPATLAAVRERFPAIDRYYREPAAGLSGGEQQQLAIARALISEPRLLLLDEPSLGLAPLVVADVFRALDELRAQGVTIVLVEQNATQALALADRSYVMRTGSVVVHGTRAEMAARDDIHEAYLGAGVR